MQRHAQASFSRNRLLSMLPAAEFEAIRSSLIRVSLQMRDTLEHANQPIEHVYFLEPSVASVVAITPGGERLEVGLFGPEGMSGVALIHGTDRSPHETFIQVPGDAIRMDASDFQTAMRSGGAFAPLMLRYAQAFAIQVASTALANGRHTVEERLARWLLMCHDRVDGNVVALTHEFLALMLGIRRASVTNAIHILEGAHIVRSTRGRLEILDRKRLEEGASDSYGMAEAEYERLIGGR